MNAPLVLPLDPERGWEQADVLRRRFAVLCAVQLVAWPLLCLLPLGEYVMVALAMTAGPPAFYSAARVLRPHADHDDRERVARHWASSTSTSFGWGVLSLLVDDSGPAVGMLVILPALVGLLVTVQWGLVALVVRALSTPVPHRVRPAGAQPLPAPQR